MCNTQNPASGFFVVLAADLWYTEGIPIYRKWLVWNKKCAFWKRIKFAMNVVSVFIVIWIRRNSATIVANALKRSYRKIISPSKLVKLFLMHQLNLILY
jgi:hypothetical protein